MQRTIVTSKDAGLPSGHPRKQLAGDPKIPDSYLTRVLKLIPAEVVSLYVTVTALAASAPAGSYPVITQWCAFVLGLLGTPYYLWVLAKVRKVGQIVLSMAAFFVWVAALGGHPFDSFGVPAFWWAILLVVFTFVLPIPNPGATPEPAGER